VVSGIFLLPLWPETAAGGLFSPVVRALRCVVASRLAQSATGRQPTTGILLPVQRQVNIRRCRSPGYYCALQRLSDCWPASSDGNICGSRQTGSGCLSTGSSFATAIPCGDLRQFSLSFLVKEVWKSVSIWRSYGQKYSGTFWLKMANSLVFQLPCINCNIALKTLSYIANWSCVNITDQSCKRCSMSAHAFSTAAKLHNKIAFEKG